MALAARSRYLLGLPVVGAVLLWAYWPTLFAMADKWSTDPQYSHGFLVPAFAGYLLWHRRRLLPSPLAASSRWGMVLILFGIGLHLAGAYFFFDTLSMLSLLPMLAGICVCVGGRPALRWAWPSIAFLVFML